MEAMPLVVSVHCTEALEDMSKPQKTSATMVEATAVVLVDLVPRFGAEIESAAQLLLLTLLILLFRSNEEELMYPFTCPYQALPFLVY